MSSFLNSTQLGNLQSVFQNHFDTFASGISNYVTVYREPTKVINNVNSLNLFGYSEDSLNPTDITYQPNTGYFPCMVISPQSIQTKQFTELKFSLDKNEIYIKVEDNCRDYIQREKVEHMLVNNIKYNLVSNYPQIQNYFGLKFYYFKLEATQ